MDKKKFELICQTYNDNLKIRDTIGLLNEKSLHAILKIYMEENFQSFSEQRIGPFFVDLFNGQEVCEIQTRNLGALKKKLDYLLPLYPVTIVYPLAAIKYLSWIDVDSSEVSEPRKSPKKQRFADAFWELYKIREYLSNENLHIKLMLLSVHDFKLKNGYGKDKKIRAQRYERIPLELIDELDIDGASDYFKIVPYIEGNFDIDRFAKEIKLDKSRARTSLNIMISLGLCSVVGKNGRKYVYRFQK